MAENLSRSEIKRQFKQTEQLAAELAEITDNDIKKLPAGDEVKAEIRAIRALKGGARKRQVKYLAKLIRLESLADIYDFLSERKGSDLKNKKLFHEAERLRDAIINEAIQSLDDAREEQRTWDLDWPSREIAAAMASYPDLSEDEIRKVAYSFVKTRNRAHYRELFRMFKAAIEQREVQEKLQ